MVEPICWPLEAIWQTVGAGLPGFTCEVLPMADSTNSELMRRFKAGQTEPTLLVAEQQTAGRGRLGRQWHSQRGSSLTFSLGLRLAPEDWSGLSLAVGISLAESLDAANTPFLRIALKWPNDLWLVQGKTVRKLGGILVETATFEGCRFVIMGVGINVQAVAGAEFGNIAPSSLSSPSNVSIIPPGCLQDMQTGADVATTLQRVVAPLVHCVLAFEQSGFAPFQSRFACRDVLAGRDVQLSDGTHGQARGVTLTGALLVHTSQGMKEITSSEISVRPC